jgi:hypothetical protein
MASYDDLNTKRIFAVGILSVVVTAVTALAVQVVYYALLQWQEQIVTESSDYARQNEVLETQQAEVSSYGVDAETGNFTIPIEKSMELMVSQATEPGTENDQEQSGGDDSLSL